MNNYRNLRRFDLFCRKTSFFRKYTLRKEIVYCVIIFFLSNCARNVEITHKLQLENDSVSDFWNNPASWIMSVEDGCKVSIIPYETDQNGFILHYDLSVFGPKPGYGWVNVEKELPLNYNPIAPIALQIKSLDSDSDIEIKYIDRDGSVYGKKVPLSNYQNQWKRIVFSIENFDYWWGGDAKFDGFGKFALAISGRDSGIIYIKDIGPARSGEKLSFSPGGPRLDPNRELSGFGRLQRRDSLLIPEDPLVIEYLKVLQDNSSPDRNLIPSMENDEAHTFNNALIAMAFILKGEKERAERILNFYQSATDKDNRDIRLQNFYVNGEARGFYQMVSLKTHRDEIQAADRWIGDMAWLLIAYKYYEYVYQSDKYSDIATLLKELLISFFKVDDNGGYIQHGWRNGDQQLHYKTGHPEGNIDCYAAFRLCGEMDYAKKIKIWLDKVLNTNPNLFIDLYSWRVLAFGKEYASVLNIPEYDLRFRKTIVVDQDTIIGFYHGPDNTIENIWLDGVGQMACTFIAYGDKYRGYFYANQLDKMIFEKQVNGKTVRAIPYTVNKTGGYEWVNPSSGFLSTIAWYIFAKNEFNPLNFLNRERL